MCQDKIISAYLQKALSIFKCANIVLPKEATVNIYHHCGKDHIDEMGAMFINVVNRDYCKSYVIMLPHEGYPGHYHRIKIESFYVLYGDLEVLIDGAETDLVAGDMIHIDRGQDHSFCSRTGVVFEEISTMYVPNDSIYLEANVQNTTYEQRRTTIKAKEWKELRREWIK